MLRTTNRFQNLVFDKISRWFCMVLCGEAKKTHSWSNQEPNSLAWLFSSFWASPASLLADCSLRQGAGGTEFARFGLRTSFLRWFYNRSQTYFGQKSEEQVDTVKKFYMEVKTTIFFIKMRLKNKNKVRFSLTFPAYQGHGTGPHGPIRAHMGPYGPIGAHMDPKNPTRYVNKSLY